MTKVMYIMRGLPGSGKSYFISTCKFAFETSSIRNICSADQYFMVGNNYLFDITALGAAHRMCKFKVEAACKAGLEDVFIDNTNTTWKEIYPYVELANKYGYEIMFTSPNTSWAFDVEECFKRNAHDVPKEVIQAMKDRWQDSNAIFHSMNTEFPNVKASFI